MTQILIRRGDSTAVAGRNPILADGEPGWERDTKVFKIGDGVTAWNNLEAVGGGGGGAIGSETLALINDAKPKPDLTTNLRKPFYIAHRGGHLVHGEHSMEAYAARAAQGFAIEPDVSILSDGGLACIHDGTTTRTMVQLAGTAQVNVNQITSTQFVRDYRVLPELNGGTYETPALLPDVLDQFGGRVLICPEMKSVSTREAVCAEIVKRGLQKAVIAQSFNFDDVAYSASLGIVSAWLTDTGSPTEMLNAGIRFASPSINATDAYVDSCRAAGLELIRWTVNTRTQADTMIATNRADGIFSDDPEWVSRRTPIQYVDPFRKGVPWPHMVSAGDRTNQIFRDGGVGYRYAAGLTTTGSPNDWHPPLGTGRARIYFTLSFGPEANAQSRWASLAFGQFSTPELPFYDNATAGQNCWHVLIRRDGSMAIYEVLNGAAAAVRASVGAGAGGAYAAAGRDSGDIPFMFERSATNVTMTNLKTGDTLTWADAANMAVDARSQFNFNGTDAIFKNVRVVPLA